MSDKPEIVVTPRFSFIEVKHCTKDWATGKIIKEWSTWHTWFTFFTDVDEVN